MMTPAVAIETLRSARVRAHREEVKTLEVRAALIALKPHVDRAHLDALWSWADWPHGTDRSQNIHAALNRILRQMGRPSE